MASLPRVLAQLNPAAATDQDLYTVPQKIRTVVSSIVVCNRSNATRSYRLWIAVTGAVTSNAQYVRFDKVVAAFSNEDIRLGISLGPGDVIRCRADQQQLSFSVFGIEMDGWLEGQVP
jgi:hypothetical protein